ncbi:MAG: tyrosine-type recombinase/integrase [Elusimicrobiota bacterium]
MKDPRDRRVKRPHFKTGPKPRRGVGELWELLDRHLAWMEATGYSRDSRNGARSDILTLIGFLEHLGIDRLANVTLEVMHDYALWLKEREHRWIPGQKLATSYVWHRLNGAQRFFKWVTNSGLLLYNPAEDLELPRRGKRLPRTILTEKEVKRLLEAPDLKDASGYRDRVLFEVFYATGIRTNELFQLKIKDLDLKGRLLCVREGKGRKDRLIPMPIRTTGYLNEYLTKVRPLFAAKVTKDQGFVFLKATGNRYDGHALKKSFSKALKKIGLFKPVSAMTFRHSIATHLLENDMDIRAIQEFLGHERLDTTEVYARVTMSGLRKHFNRHHPRERRRGKSEESK